MGSKITDNWLAFFSQSDAVIDLALGNMTIDIERIAKQRVPVNKARLLQSGRGQRIGPKNFQVSFNTEYAAYQEAGQRSDGSRIVHNYSKPGTGRHFLRGAGETIGRNGLSYFRAAALRKGMI